MRTPTLHFNAIHPLARVAAGHCDSHSAPLVGGLACGACWERAIRDDERFVTEFGLPRQLTRDPEDIDEIAVERACDGERLPLTSAELIAAIHQLRREGMSAQQITDRLQAGERLVVREITGIPAGRTSAHHARTGAAA